MMFTRREICLAFGAVVVGFAGAATAGCSNPSSSGTPAAGGTAIPSGLLSGRAVQVRRDPG